MGPVLKNYPRKTFNQSLPDDYLALFALFITVELLKWSFA